jgi:hypothetical protein
VSLKEALDHPICILIGNQENVVCMREMTNAYKVEVHKPKWKRSVHGWKHNIKLYPKKRGQKEAVFS